MVRIPISLVIVALLGTFMPISTAAAVESEVVTSGATWRINDEGIDLGNGWKSKAYPDAAWSSGRAQAGFGDGDEATKVDPGRRTYYFRKSFNVATTAGITGLRLRSLIDDAAVVYLNGSEIWRSANLPAGQTYDTFATSYVAGSAEKTWKAVELPATRLVSGTNVVAVEVHQHSTWSSDLSFDLELAALSSGSVAKPAIPSGVAASAIGPAAVDVSWDPVAGASSYQVMRDGVLVAEPSETSYRDTGLNVGTAYKYSVRALNGSAAGSVSGTVSVTTTDGPRVMCRITDSRLPEMSGMIASVRHPSIVWAHNDSGDSPRIFAIDVNSCKIRATVSLSGAAAVDFEAISMGRNHAGNPELWVADVGDNSWSRNNVKLYRFDEPTSLADQSVSVRTVRVTWSDGARDCEALMVDPVAGGDVFLVSKESSGGVYRLRGDFRSTGTATTGSRLSSTRAWASDASISPDRTRTVVRFYDRATMFNGVPGTSPRNFTLPSQAQGEAITFSRDSRHLFIASEGKSDLIRIPVAGL